MKLKERTIMIWITMVMFGVSIAVISVWGYLQDIGAQSSVFVNVALGNVALFGLSVLALVHSLEVATDKVSARIFMVMVVLVYLGVICDNLSWALDGSVRYSIENCMLNAGAYLINPIILVMFWYYQNRVFFDDSQHSKKIKLIVSFIAIVDIVYILIGTATGWLFYIGSDGVYYYGDGFFVIYACPIIIILCCIYENLRREFPLQKRVSLLAFGVVPMFALLFSILSPDYSITYIAFYFNLTLVYGTVQVKKEQEIAKKNAIIAERDVELAQREIQIMVSQIQPHFLYNTLTAIYTLCDTDTALAQKTIQKFSNYLRANMDGIGTNVPIPFEKELAHTKTYLEIEKLRFGDMLNIEYDIAVDDFMIPALTLQPIVENAVRYGIRSREDGGTVTIFTKRMNGNIYLTIHDDGMGFDVNAKKDDGKSHLGIDNTRRRLRQMINADMIIDSQLGIGTTVTIIIGD